MVNPLYLFAASLAAAFLLPLIDKLGRRVALGFVFAAIASWGVFAVYGLIALASGASSADFGTAGFVAPLAIVLRTGLEELLAVTAISVVGLLAAASMYKALGKAPLGGAVSLLMTIMGLCGIVLTRDLFNLFVFLEISAIATYGLIGFDDRKASMRSAFKYMMAGGIASSLYLIGVIYIYRFGDTLNLDIAIQSPALSGAAGTMAVFFLLASLLLELKPFPANGWAIDVYETANPGVSALLSGASATALLYALWKIMPLLGTTHLTIVASAGLVTFAARRMLGYSSSAQIGLIAAVMALGRLFNFGPELTGSITAGLLVNHLLAKTGLFLLSARTEDDSSRLDPITLAGAGALAIALVGLPPFPGFWAKWNLIGMLAGSGHWWLVGIILVSSLVEAFYILNWFGRLAHRKIPSTDRTISTHVLSALILAVALLALGIWMGRGTYIKEPLLWASLAVAAGLFFIDAAPGWFKAILSVLATAGFGYLAYARLDGIKLFFAIMLLGGGMLYSLAATYRPGQRKGLHPLLAATTLAMGGILVAGSGVELFFAWETMTIASWLLVLRGNNGEKAGIRYIVFNLGGAFLLMAGLLSPDRSAAYLVVAGLLVKAGALGLHIWLPSAYAESNDEVSGFLSSTMSKASVFLLSMALLAFGTGSPSSDLPLRILGWIGLATALFGALYAVYQEDIKKTLAWSSMSQIGYIILALAMMDEAGWTTGFYLSFNHFLYKGMLFLAVAGIIQRTGTRNMYEMGGLIKKMPFSFFSVLIAIIALSGVPPLSGFGGKWLLYTSLINKGWYLEAAVAFFSSAVAFLYLFRLIHTIFLGQPKPNLAAVKETSPALIVPQTILMIVLFAISALPNLILRPIMNLTSTVFEPVLALEGAKMTSPLGYWNGTLSMIVTIVVFLLCLIWMLINLHNPQSVKQFNIVFAAERPYKPETTHFAWNFYAPYERALGFLTQKRSEKFWAAAGTGVNAIGGAFRRLYTGNGQTYALHIVLYVAVLFLCLGVF